MLLFVSSCVMRLVGQTPARVFKSGEKGLAVCVCVYVGERGVSQTCLGHGPQSKRGKTPLHFRRYPDKAVAGGVLERTRGI